MPTCNSSGINSYNAMKRLGWISTYSRRVLLGRHFARQFAGGLFANNDPSRGFSQDGLQFFRLLIELATLPKELTGRLSATCDPPSNPNCSILEHCIDPRRLALFIARSALRDLIAGLQADAKGVQAV
ncbi:hypothetical protein [Cypionkella sp.]|uniref:hypothetical protein n=1 Tax=Cypionkella sp. TaxID=2811411 RepID=UPI0027160B38|nr:hypothetical protein [Cypionkella sp.]MDO8986140.1 hypothetical protein [Cypionkella sp.]MDP2047485.1 hypothetical protein [Cypionkella sp.]